MKKLETPVVPIAYTPPRAAAALDVGVDYFDDHIAPHLRVIRCGRKRLYPVTELERWLIDNAETPMAEQVGGGNS